MPASDSSLIASAATVEGIAKLVNRFYFSSSYVVRPNTLTIYDSRTGKIPNGVRVVRQGKRYRLELTNTEK